MSLTDAILVAVGTFVAVVTALSIVARAAMGKNAEKLVALREQQRESLELSGTQMQEAYESLGLSRQRADQAHQRNVDLQTRAEQSWMRWEENQERWA